MSPFPFGVTTLAGEIGGRDVMNPRSTQTLWPHVSLRKHGRFSSLFAAGDGSRGGTSRSSARNVPSDEEQGETAVFSQANYM